jgi:hypothetical protein
MRPGSRSCLYASGKKKPAGESGLNPILGRVGGDKAIMLHCKIYGQSIFQIPIIGFIDDNLRKLESHGQKKARW